MAFRKAISRWNVLMMGLSVFQPRQVRSLYNIRVGTITYGPTESLEYFTAAFNASSQLRSGDSEVTIIKALRTIEWYILKK